MIIYLPGRVSPLPFVTPEDQCCNCGCTSELRKITVNLKHTRYFLFIGTELTFSLSLPFCSRCARTATRLRQGVFSKALVVFGVFWVIMGLLIFTLPESAPGLIRKNLPSTAAILACLLTWIFFYLLRKPAKPRTGNYQPVYLQRIKQGFRGEIKSLTLGFTNPEYALLFRKSNASFCDAGALIAIND
ncbi:hypothetical protein [Pseudoduganella sp. RAF53_2]|uniref:hypothetical protein n=1 Tax=unclassified Pseudoduganella TaxID=2637179 RepID=UPI003F9A3BE1